MTNTHALALDHNDALQLLPWHVQGTLAAEEATQVSAHLDACDECRREAHALRTVFDVAQQRSGVVDERRLDALMDRIDAHEANADQASRGTSPSPIERAQRWLEQWWSPRWALPAGAMAAAVFAWMLWLPQGAPPTGDYEVHSGGESSGPQLHIDFNAPPAPGQANPFIDHPAVVDMQAITATQYRVQVRSDLPVDELSALILELEGRADIATVNIAAGP